MTPERWKQVEAVFERALELPFEERSAFLNRSCGNDEELRREIESLLKFDEDSDEFLEQPAIDITVKSLPEMSLKPEQRLGSYRIVSHIGSGGMGEVYLAQDEKLNRRVALKFVRFGIGGEQAGRRFLREAQILANLNHPNIAQLHGAEMTPDGFSFLVMEYVEGVRIDKYCYENHLSIRDRLQMFRRVCSAVHYAHQRLIIHRDIKPANILITNEGEPKLLDFGIAKLLDAEGLIAGEQTMTFAAAMTPEYASPEQVRGDTMTTASDVYSLGVILYELLTGKRPYQIKHRNPAEIARVISEHEPARPSTAIVLRDEDSKSRVANPKLLKGDLDNIVLKAMRKESQRRYASAEQLSDDIRRHLEGLPIMAHKDTLSYRSVKFVMRHKVGMTAAAVVVFALVTGIIGTFSQARIARHQARIAMQERDRVRIEMAKAERINQFLQDTLGFADPGWFSASKGKGPNATIGEALDQASKRAESELADQPEVLAGVLSTVGTSYQNLAQFDLAERDLRKALELYESIYGGDSVQVAGATKSVAEILMLKASYPAAEQLLQAALAIYRKHAPDGSVKPLSLCETLADLGLLKLTEGQPAPSEAFLREALAVSSQLVGGEREKIPLVLTHLGQARAAQGQFDEAISLYRNATDEYRMLPGGERSELATTLSYLGDAQKLKGNYTEAESSLRGSVEIARRVSGENSPHMAIAMNNLAEILYLKSDYGAAEEAANTALRIANQLLPAGHPGFAWTQTLLGLIMNKTGRSRQAEPTLRDALAIRERVLPKDHWQIAATKGALGESLTMQNRYGEAEPLLIESYESLKASQGETNPRTTQALQRLIVLYQNWGKPEEAGRYSSQLSNIVR